MSNNYFDEGYNYLTGTNVTKDINKALECFMKDSNNEDSISYVFYCNILLNNNDINDNIRKLKKLAKTNICACDILFNLYYEGKLITKDINEAIKYKEMYVDFTPYFKDDEVNELIQICKDYNLDDLVIKFNKKYFKNVL